MHSGFLCKLVLGSLLLLPAGCGSIMSGFAGDWGQLSKDRNDVAAIKEGMWVSDVTAKIGKPMQMEEGDNIYVGWQQWIYPTGYLLVYRGKVRQVYVKPRTSEVDAALAKANSKGFEFGFEDAKESNRIQDEQDLERQKAEMWGTRKKIKKNPYAETDFSEGALTGFSR